MTVAEPRIEAITPRARPKPARTERARHERRLGLGLSAPAFIVMIIVTFAASEAAELGVPSSMGGLSSAVAPIAPLALGLGALAKARAAWIDPYSRREAFRSAAFASAMLFLMLALSPVGVVRVPPRPPQPAHKQVAG